MKLRKNAHRRIRDHKTTMDLGILYPMNFIDVPMGQTTILKASASMRFQPMVSPAMTDIHSNIVHFYVPYRILWDKWGDFISMKTKMELPTCRIFADKSNSVFDTLNYDFSKTLLEYAGFPKKLDEAKLGKVNLDWNIPFLWFMAYYKIWDEHFRDDEIQKDQAIDFEQLFKDYEAGVKFGNDGSAIANWNAAIKKLFGLKRVNWGADRFTKALLETEIDPQISLPVGSDGNPFKLQAYTNANPPVPVKDRYSPMWSSGTSTSTGWAMSTTGSFNTDFKLGYGGEGLTGVDLGLFRTAVDMFNFKMNQSIYGSEYDDYLRKYGVRNMDGRLQRSEFIGGFSDRIKISDVIATDGTDLGKQGGHAYGSVNRKVFRHYAPEAGVIISMMYLRPKAQYAGGIDRFFFKRDALDFPQIEFCNGHQAIYSLEIGRSNKGGLSIPKDEAEFEIFGYEERYSEYRSNSHMVTGSLVPQENLAHWCNPREFTATPFLNNQFLTCDPSTGIWSAPNEDKAIVHYVGDFTALNWLPKKTPVKMKL